MVHALERARQHLHPYGDLVLIQPHQWKRPSIAITSRAGRQPVAALVNPTFQPLIDAAAEAIHTVVDERLFVPIGTSHPHFRLALANPAELRRYLHLGQRPPRFPVGGRERFRSLWELRPADARIEVTEWMTVLAFRAGSV